MRTVEFIRREISGWEPWEAVYLIGCTAAIAGISIALDDTALGIASAITGTLYTLLAGKGKISCYFFGIFNSAAYGYIAYKNGLYGDAMLNWFWYLPMMVAGIIFWRKKINESGCVIKRNLTFSGRIITLFSTLAGIALYAWLLRLLNDTQPVVDSATTVLSVTAMILTVKRCVEQWLMWILVNFRSVIMWLRVFLAGDNSVATLLWWIIMLFTGMIFFFRWTKELREQRQVS